MWKKKRGGGACLLLLLLCACACGCPRLCLCCPVMGRKNQSYIALKRKIEERFSIFSLGFCVD